MQRYRTVHLEQIEHPRVIETVRENVIPETGGNTTSVGNFGYDEAIPIRLLL